MPALETPAAKTGIKAAPFNLKGTDGAMHSLEQVRGPKGLLVMFICNHCPYVKRGIVQLVSNVKELQELGLGVVAIMSNDTTLYPEDSYNNMKRFASDHAFTFPYLVDETQSVAKAYNAICTPDFFGFNTDLTLQYRGRLDELLVACKEIVATGKTTMQQFSSIGCSIKWKQ